MKDGLSRKRQNYSFAQNLLLYWSPDPQDIVILIENLYKQSIIISILCK